MACGATATLAFALLLAAGGAPPAATGRSMSHRQLDELLSSISNWGRWGKDDQLGALNLITPEKRRQAAQLVKEGVSVSLAHNVLKIRWTTHRSSSTAWSARASRRARIRLPIRYAVQYHGYSQTHLDALCHLFYKGKMYNGIPQTEVTASGAGKLSVLYMKDGLFTRGVLMDLPRLLGVKYLPGNKAIYPEDLDAWEKKAGVKVESGDAILIRTGRWARRQAEGDWKFEEDSAGLHASCLRWLKSRDIAILGSDLASDVMPSGIEGLKLPVHWGAIWAMGVPILDNCDLERLSETAAQRHRWEFLLTAAPLAVEGGTGSPINPVASF